MVRCKNAFAALEVAFFAFFNWQNPSGAQAQEEARTIHVRAMAASGLFPKVFTVRGRIAGEAVERELARFEYGGLNPAAPRPTGWPTEWIRIDNVESAYLQLDIDVRYKTPDTLPVMRSDDPKTSDYLFYRDGAEWIRRPGGIGLDLFNEAACRIVDHAWEDGGGFREQDLFFQIQIGNCAQISSR